MSLEMCAKHEMLDGELDPSCRECQRKNGVRKA